MIYFVEKGLFVLCEGEKVMDMGKMKYCYFCYHRSVMGTMNPKTLDWYEWNRKTGGWEKCSERDALDMSKRYKNKDDMRIDFDVTTGQILGVHKGADKETKEEMKRYVQWWDSQKLYGEMVKEKQDESRDIYEEGAAAVYPALHFLDSGKKKIPMKKSRYFQKGNDIFFEEYDEQSGYGNWYLNKFYIRDRKEHKWKRVSLRWESLSDFEKIMEIEYDEVKEQVLFSKSTVFLEKAKRYYILEGEVYLEKILDEKGNYGWGGGHGNKYYVRLQKEHEWFFDRLIDSIIWSEKVTLEIDYDEEEDKILSVWSLRLPCDYFKWKLHNAVTKMARYSWYEWIEDEHKWIRSYGWDRRLDDVGYDVWEIDCDEETGELIPYYNTAPPPQFYGENSGAGLWKIEI